MDPGTLKNSTLPEVIEILFRLSLAVLLVVTLATNSLAQEGQRDREAQDGAQPVPKPPGNFLNFQGGGQSQQQPVGQPKTDLDVDVLPRSGEAEIGKRFTFDVTVVNEGANRASNVKLTISALAQSAQGASIDPANAIRYDAAQVESGNPGAKKDCVASENARLCDVGVIMPNERRKATVQVTINRSVPPGELALSAIAQIDNNNAGEDRKTIRLVSNPRTEKNVDLKVTIERAVNVASPGSNVIHVVKVRNTSDRDAATQVQLRIEQRLVVRARGQFEVFKDGFQGGPSETSARCTAQEHTFVCDLGTVGPKKEIRVPVEAAALLELPAKRWGQIRTKAWLRSAENDPNRDDNTARQYTSIVSRLPEIAIFSRVPDGSGNPKIIPVQSLTHGQEFAIAARFMDPSVEVSGREIRVQLVVEGSTAIEVPLRYNPYSSYDPARIYRSERFRLVEPGKTIARDPKGPKPIPAPRGTPIKAVFTPPAQSSPQYRLDRDGQSWATVLVVGGR